MAGRETAGLAATGLRAIAALSFGAAFGAGLAAAFGAAGFTKITLACAEDPKAPDAGQVTGQEPAGGSPVAPDATLKVTITAKKCP